MNKRTLYIFFALALSSAGCEKYLDKEPDNRTNIKTPEQISQLLTSAYPKANYILFCEAMSDNAEDKQGGGTSTDYIDRINSQAYHFEVIEDGPDFEDSPTFYWNACYTAIASANQALEIIAQSPDSVSLSAQKGEALVARAYAHFMLVTLFAKVYNPAAADEDPGIPYVTERETVTLKEYDRKTVAYDYEMIEKDLTEGYPLISDQIYGSAPKFHFNKKAAAAFAARFYMFKEEYDKVVTYATAALGDVPTENLKPWNTVLQSLQYFQFQAEYTKSTTQGNLLLQEARSVWGRSLARVRYGFGVSVLNQIFSDNVSGGQFAYPIYGNSQAYNIPKFYEFFVRENINANSGSAYNTIPLFTGEEALLNRAEAYLRLGNSSASVNDLNTFLSVNIEDYDPSTHRVTASRCGNYYGVSSVTGVFLAILDMKRAFFLQEGMRWFDIIRVGIPIVHASADGQVVQVLPDDNRRVLQLPVLTKQAGLAPNPR